MLRSTLLCRSAALLCLVLAAGGCVRRTLSITSDPSGALVWLNDREIGRTPVEVDFVHYGTYDVRLVREGCEPLLTFGEARPPLWDNVPLDFVAEILPAQLESRIKWHYELQPRNDDRGALLERARDLRAASQADEDQGGEGGEGE